MVNCRLRTNVPASRFSGRQSPNSRSTAKQIREAISVTFMAAPPL